MDPLLALLLAATDEQPPPPDGSVVVLPPQSGPVFGVLAFTAHHVVAAPVTDEWVAAHVDATDVAGAMKPPFLSAVGRAIGRQPGTLDVVLAAHAAGPEEVALPLEPIAPDDSHPRVARALRYRDEVRAWATADGAGVLVLGRGLARRWEVAFEVAPAARGRGLGRALAVAALGLVPPGETVFAQVAPGNVASLRAVLGTGRFRPIGAEVLFASAV